MDNGEDNGNISRLLAGADEKQMEAALGAVANAVGAYYKTLKNSGFNDEVALQLSLGFQQTMLEVGLMMHQKSD